MEELSKISSEVNSPQRYRHERLGMLEIKKLALSDDDSILDFAKEIEYQKDNHTMDLDTMQRKLSTRDAQLEKLEDHIQANDQKHQMSSEKLLDSMNVLNVALDRILGMMQQASGTRRKASRSPAD